METQARKMTAAERVPRVSQPVLEGSHLCVGLATEKVKKIKIIETEDKRDRNYRKKLECLKKEIFRNVVSFGSAGRINIPE